MDLSIAVISYNTRDLLLACLQSVEIGRRMWTISDPGG